MKPTLGLKLFVLILVTMAFGAMESRAQPITIVSITNLWSYNQAGTDLTGQFNQPGYSDTNWPTGRGLLGLEASNPYPYPYPILTPLTVGGGRITYYFRTHFNFPFSPDGYTLVTTNYVDDGAVFYLNGSEVGRIRIGPGTVTAGTMATNATPEGQAVVLNVPASSLVKGINLLAVEVHQTAANSSDIVFGMNLTAIPPVGGPVTITAQPTSGSVQEGDSVNFTAGVSGTPPYFFQWFKDDAPIANATNASYSINSVTTNDAGVYFFTVSNSFSSATSSNAVLTVTPRPYEIFPITNIWKYNQTGANLGTAWRQTNFIDSGWPAGAALLYNENAALPAPKNTPLALTSSSGQPILTYYFRTHFDWPENPTGAVLTARALIDDGAVFYVNGAEAKRIGMPAGTIAYNTLAARTVSDATSFETFSIAATNLVQGDNLLAVEVHQASTNSSDIVFGMALGTNFTIPLPDLVLWASAVNPRIETHTFANNDCELNECAVAGTRRLLRFDTETRNVGTADLLLGDPSGNPLFVYDPCHGHYHFLAFAAYRLLDSNGALAAIGNKVGFCLEDLERWDAAANPAAVYDCSYQGIQRGWADIYNSGLPCQYIDITGVPTGDYFLELEIDPENHIQELNEANNITRVPVTIYPPCTAPPSNDNFSAAQVIPYSTVTVLGHNDCATKQGSEPDHAGNKGGASVWYQWTAPYTGLATISTEGSGFDTILGLYRGSSLNSLATVASDDDNGEGFTSSITTNVTLNTIYYIAVDGYDGEVGPVVLNINPAGNDQFSACFAITGMAGAISGRNTTATLEPNEPNHAGVLGGHSLWYCWTAPTNRPFMFDTLGSKFDTLLAVYAGSTLGALTPVASDNNSGPYLTSRVMFDAVAGTTYRIAIDGVGGSSGLCTLNWRPAVRIDSLTQVTGGFQFDVAGMVGDHYVVEISSNLTLWTPWLHFTNSNGSVQIIDSGTSTNDHRFFRVRME